jgi:hypothetical protein
MFDSDSSHHVDYFVKDLDYVGIDNSVDVKHMSGTLIFHYWTSQIFFFIGPIMFVYVSLHVSCSEHLYRLPLLYQLFFFIYERKDDQQLQ